MVNITPDETANKNGYFEIAIINKIILLVKELFNDSYLYKNKREDQATPFENLSKFK